MQHLLRIILAGCWFCCFSKWTLINGLLLNGQVGTSVNSTRKTEKQSYNVSGNFEISTTTSDVQTHDDEYPLEDHNAGFLFKNRSRDLIEQQQALMIPDDRPLECVRQETCQLIHRNITEELDRIDVNFEYNSTAWGARDVVAVIEQIEYAARLKHHHACGEAVQPLLFAIILPKCLGGRKRLIPKAECLKMREECGEVIMDALPEAFQLLQKCDNESVFTDDITCEGEISWFAQITSNVSFTCPFPLKSTNDSLKSNTSIKNGQCGLQCHNPFFDENELSSIHIFVAVLVALSFLFNGSAFVSLALRWRTLTKYPDTCLLFINICFLMAGIGWALQFIPGARDKITCSEDQTMRLGEPRLGESYGLCLVTFILVYYFVFAAAIWFVSLTYCWYRSFRTVYINEVKAKGFLKNYSVRFHAAAWLTPLLMTLIVIATSGIDGNNLTGICFIGLEWGYVRGFLLIMPMLVVIFVSGFFMVRGLILLYRIRHEKENNLSSGDKQNIRSTMLHIGFIAVLVCICIFISVFIHAHYYINQEYYEKVKLDFVNCHLNSLVAGESDKMRHEKCLNDMTEIDYETIELGIHLALQFLAGIGFSSWVWRSSQVKRWFQAARRSLKQVRTPKSSVTTMASPCAAPTGVSNVSFVPDESTTKTVEIELTEKDSSEVMYGSVYESVDGSAGLAKDPVVVFSNDTDSSGDSSAVPAENPLENWQEKAKEIRMRKKSSTVSNPGTPRVIPVGFLQSTSTTDTSVILMTPSGQSKQRRPGRVEFFKQGQFRAPSQTTLRSVSQMESSLDGMSTAGSQDALDSAPIANGGLQLPTPGKSILKNRSPSPFSLDSQQTRDSPDEGIDIEAGQRGSRESVVSMAYSEEDVVQLKEPVEMSDA